MHRFCISDASAVVVRSSLVRPFPDSLYASDRGTEPRSIRIEERAVRNGFSATPDGDEPSAEELNEIERESGLIAAEMVLLDAEIRIMTAEHRPTPVDWQRLRRAMRQVLRELAALHTRQRRQRDRNQDRPQSPEGDAA
jgi:hypothetical protein